MGATTRFDAARFAGKWDVVAKMADASSDEADFPDALVFAKPGGPEYVVEWDRMVCGRYECLGSINRFPAQITAPGKISLFHTPPSGREVAYDLWVLWVDDGFRTAVIGTPDGSLGWIMDRKGRKGISEDRLTAAKEILEWAGYDLSRLVMTRD